MSFYTNHIYPYLVHTLGDPEPIRAVRRRVIPLAEGEVLKIGVGSGANFAHYDPARVSKLYALEPNPAMVRRAERRRRHLALDIAFLDLPGERIPLPDGAIDTVVSTLTLCTIPDVVAAIRGIRRVLRPGGRLIFFELMRAPDPSVLWWQELWEPIQYRLYAGLSLTRDIPALLAEGGFKIEQLDTAYLAPFPKAWTYSCWGAASPHFDE